MKSRQPNKLHRVAIEMLLRDLLIFTWLSDREGQGKDTDTGS